MIWMKTMEKTRITIRMHNELVSISSIEYNWRFSLTLNWTRISIQINGSVICKIHNNKRVLFFQMRIKWIFKFHMTDNWVMRTINKFHIFWIQFFAENFFIQETNQKKSWKKIFSIDQNLFVVVVEDLAKGNFSYM